MMWTMDLSHVAADVLLQYDLLNALSTYQSLHFQEIANLIVVDDFF